MLDVIALVLFSGWVVGCFAASFYKEDVRVLVSQCEKKLGRKVEFY